MTLSVQWACSIVKPFLFIYRPAIGGNSSGRNPTAARMRDSDHANTPSFITFSGEYFF